MDFTSLLLDNIIVYSNVFNSFLFSFRKQGYNFIEHFVLNAYMASQRLILRIAIFPITKYYTESNYNKLFVDILMLMDIVLIFGHTSPFSIIYQN